MKILIVGAGAIGGYFGGRLLEKGEDVTFLVREKRKAQLEETGLKIKSVNGDSRLVPKLITAENAGATFDVVVISTKSYQLRGAIEDIRPFVGEGTMILPLLNGIAHIDVLIEAFGDSAVIGGLCFIESTLDENGAVIQTSPINQLVYGERTGEKTERVMKLQKAFEGTKAEFIFSEKINQDMWHKYLFIAAMSGITAAMESPIGPIRDLETGRRTIAAFIKELAEIMFKIGAPVKETIAQEQIEKINAMAAGMKSSMQRDVEKSLPIEAEHLQGYLLEKANEHNVDVPILETIYTKLMLYEQTYIKSKKDER
ncbi:ketopantoate reductase family protein [Planomicrobium sp. CPCC 101110]|uniref:ketopantoate reductase family protein n=1 Tax=Planomicrobium sp. CPCC 101110 TaxID=2599619 RepID=UPI0011B80F53|nr:ketopantoate reductase family protein [Planomicrobium sp. CPCC 101110]TWT24766.1 ketopantoate reductase family protein [Planomicrobium sp. CPCC 101110]